MSTDRLSITEYKALTNGGTKPAKYRNVKTVVDGITFDSRLEAARYDQLRLLQKAGQVLWFIMQAPFKLPGNITYRADFLIVWNDSGLKRVSIEDCKGCRTRVSINKIKTVEALYGIKVDIITRSNVR
jgi:hypothetical protein